MLNAELGGPVFAPTTPEGGWYMTLGIRADLFHPPSPTAWTHLPYACTTSPTGRHGSTLAGLLDTIATTVSVGLRNGVPPQNYVRPGTS